MTTKDVISLYLFEANQIRSVIKLHSFYAKRIPNAILEELVSESGRYFYIRLTTKSLAQVMDCSMYSERRPTLTYTVLIAKEDCASVDGSPFKNIPYEEWVIINGFVFAEVGCDAI